MNVLTLSIKQKWFDEIVAGKKTQEFRKSDLLTLINTYAMS